MYEYTDMDGNWRLEELKVLLPGDIIERIQACLPPDQGEKADCVRWLGSPNGKFSVASMYERLREDQEAVLDYVWKKIWEWKGPRRIQVLLWLVASGNLLTSTRRGKIFNTSPICIRCGSASEDVLHALRDCVEVRRTWMQLLQGRRVSDFFNFSGKEWFNQNLSGKGCRGSDWSLIFGVSVWLFWHWRNYQLFENEFRWPKDVVMVIQNYAREIKGASDDIEIMKGKDKGGCGVAKSRKRLD